MFWLKTLKEGTSSKEWSELFLKSKKEEVLKNLCFTLNKGISLVVLKK